MDTLVGLLGIGPHEPGPFATSSSSGLTLSRSCPAGCEARGSGQAQTSSTTSTAGLNRTRPPDRRIRRHLNVSVALDDRSSRPRNSAERRIRRHPPRTRHRYSWLAQDGSLWLSRYAVARSAWRSSLPSSPRMWTGTTVPSDPAQSRRWVTAATGSTTLKLVAMTESRR
jgi:hypothetical protein